MKTFYLGIHHPQWMSQTSVPLFVSEMRLRVRKTLPRALGEWALDSGSFSQLFMYGAWSAGSERTYVEHVRRYREEIGNLTWCAPQDWMCEPVMLAKTGLSIPEHQMRTVCNYDMLMSLDSSLPFIPVLQGYTRNDYLYCIQLYQQIGVPLTGRVGIGTVCRRQGTREAEYIVRSVHAVIPDAKLHIFGAKITGLTLFNDAIESADSMAWSSHARRRDALPGHAHRNCANCLDYALQWRQKLLT